MDYAKAASSSESTGKYFNEQIIYCEKNGFDEKDLQDKLHEMGVWMKVEGFQRSDFNRKLCLVIKEEHIRNHSVENGVNLDGLHVKFYFHKSRNTDVKVLVSQVPIGVDSLEIKMHLRSYGNVEKVHNITRSYRNNTYDTGDRVLIFKKLLGHIPSYVKIRGYWAYIKYDGQPATCRICHQTDHLAADCPQNPRKKRKAQDKMNDDKDVPKASENPDKEPESNMEVQEQSTLHQPIFKNPEESEPGERTLDKFVTLEDCLTPPSLEPEIQQERQESDEQSQAWADSPEGEVTTEGSEKPQEDSSSEPATPRTVQKQIFGTDTELSEDEPARVLSIWGDDAAEGPKESTVKEPTIYCPQCRGNSHSEEECTAAVLEQANRKILSTRDSKKGKQSKSSTGGKETFKKFKKDLDLVVMRGKRTGGLDHILELSDRDNVYALYLLLTYGDYARTQHREIRMSGNKEVMDLWRRHSREGMNKDKAEDFLREVPHQL